MAGLIDAQQSSSVVIRLRENRATHWSDHASASMPGRPTSEEERQVPHISAVCATMWRRRGFLSQRRPGIDLAHELPLAPRLAKGPKRMRSVVVEDSGFRIWLVRGPYVLGVLG